MSGDNLSKDMNRHTTETITELWRELTSKTEQGSLGSTTWYSFLQVHVDTLRL